MARSLLLLCVVAGCGPRPPVLRMPEASPWRVPPEEVAVRVHTICVPPAWAWPEELEERAQEFVRLVETGLKGAGFKAVRLSEEYWTAAAHQASLEVGGVYDENEGWLDVDRLEAVRRRLRQLGHEAYGCDAYAEAGVILVYAPFSDGIVKWDGREAQQENYLSAAGTQGYTSVLSLHVRIRDPNNEELYFFAGGIEPAVEVKSFPSPFEQGWRPKEVSELLDSASNNHRAVLLALAPFLAIGPRHFP